LATGHEERTAPRRFVWVTPLRIEPPRLWKLGLARLAADTGIEITVCHFLPGTSKWNRSSIASSRRYRDQGE